MHLLNGGEHARVQDVNSASAPDLLRLVGWAMCIFFFAYAFSWVQTSSGMPAVSEQRGSFLPKC